MTNAPRFIVSPLLLNSIGAALTGNRDYDAFGRPGDFGPGLTDRQGNPLTTQGYVYAFGFALYRLIPRGPAPKSLILTGLDGRFIRRWKFGPVRLAQSRLA